MEPALRLEAPAKINLGLRVVSRRADGYHTIESLFLPLALADEIEIASEPGAGTAARPAIELSLTPMGRERGDGSRVPDDASNLAVRAARAFLEAFPASARTLGRLRIHLTKRIPAAAGLGGGSSDAGAVLRGLSALAGGPEPEALAEVALRRGADVPFFLAPAPSLVSGIGERIEPIAGLPPLVILLANPGTSLSTADVYRMWDALANARTAGLTVPDPGPTLRALFGPGADPSALSRLPGLRNDLEAAAIRLCPQVASLRDRMRTSGALFAGMSGSGATVFGVFASEADAERARAEALTEAGTWTCVTRTRQAR